MTWCYDSGSESAVSFGTPVGGPGVAKSPVVLEFEAQETGKTLRRVMQKSIKQN